MNYFKIIKLLEEYYTKNTMLSRMKGQTPFYMLISTVLSARNTDESTEIIAGKLLKKYPNPESLAKADISDVKEIIKKIGMYNIKSKRVIEVSKEIVQRFNSKTPDNLDDLISIKGVGKKTAGCVLVYAFNKDEIPVDIHVQVISQRLGWTTEKTPDKINSDLKKKIPKELWKKINELFVVHGKEICQTRKPKCEVCVVKDVCPRINVKEFT